MMAQVENQECSHLIVFSFSRFTRSVSHLLKALQKFREKNVRFVSTAEQLDTNSPVGLADLALFTILGALVQMERAQTREHSPNLNNVVAPGGQLNPTWVAWLMGYPLEWTVLEDWATRWLRSKHGRRSKGSSASGARAKGLSG
ncbi:MAG: recombinase family protein [Bdellovibrionales bacterium]|nr:recombinase family protein [Bdellovibrionales bacterium]